MIPENLRSYFSKKNTAVIALFDIDKDQTLPLWSLASGMPVSVRIKNYRWFREEEDTVKTKPDFLWFTIGKGVMTEEKDGRLSPSSDTLRTTINDQRLTIKEQRSTINDQRPKTKDQKSKGGNESR